MYCGCKRNWAEASHVATLWLKKTTLFCSVGLFMKTNVDSSTKMYQPAPCASVLELHKLSVQQQHGTQYSGLFAIAVALQVCLRSNVETAK